MFLKWLLSVASITSIIMVATPAIFSQDAISSEVENPKDVFSSLSSGCNKSIQLSSLTPPWEPNTDRPGMDYTSFWIDKNEEAFVAVGKCQDACRNDARCSAFTYVKPGIQGANGRCYLKTDVPGVRQSNCCISGVVRPKTNVDRCKNYATEAVQQNQSNIAGSCGYSGDMWSSDYQRHYARCMNGQSSDDYEAKTRKELLISCSGRDVVMEMLLGKIAQKTGSPKSQLRIISMRPFKSPNDCSICPEPGTRCLMYNAPDEGYGWEVVVSDGSRSWRVVVDIRGKKSCLLNSAGELIDSF